MKHIKTAFVLLAALCGVPAAQRDVGAAPKIIPATICNPYNAGQANDIDYVVNGVRTTAASTRQVICALPRESTIAAASVGVNGVTTSPATLPVTLYAHDTLGNLKGSTSSSGSLLFGFTLSLSAAQAPLGANLNILATLPASSNGTLYVLTPDH